MPASGHNAFDDEFNFGAPGLLLLHGDNGLWNSLRALKFDLRHLIQLVDCSRSGAVDSIANTAGAHGGPAIEDFLEFVFAHVTLRGLAPVRTVTKTGTRGFGAQTAGGNPFLLGRGVA